MNAGPPTPRLVQATIHMAQNGHLAPVTWTKVPFALAWSCRCPSCTHFVTVDASALRPAVTACGVCGEWVQVP